MAGHTSHVAKMAGLKLPVESHILQAFVTEPIKPVVDHVISWGAELFYLSQSDKGGLVFGGHIDGFNTYTQRGQFPRIQTVAECAVSLMPFISRLRLLRHWGGIQDMTPDGSPFIGKTEVKNLYLNGGWCYQGFKATPASGWTFSRPSPTTTSMSSIAALPSTASRRAGSSTSSASATGPTSNDHSLSPLRRARLQRIPLRRRRHEAEACPWRRSEPQEWHDHYFLFDNPKGPHTEYWQHVLGCRRWFKLNRNTATNEIGGVV